MSRRHRAKKSIQRTAAKHDNDCTCRTCRAASGDEEALQALMKELV